MGVALFIYILNYSNSIFYIFFQNRMGKGHYALSYHELSSRVFLQWGILILSYSSL